MKKLLFTLATVLVACTAVVSCQSKPEDSKESLAGTTWTGAGDVTDSYLYRDQLISNLYYSEITIEFVDDSYGEYSKKNFDPKDHSVSKGSGGVRFWYTVDGDKIDFTMAGGNGPEDLKRSATLLDKNTMNYVEGDGTVIKMKKK